MDWPFTVNADETYTLQNTVGENITDTEGRKVVNAQTITDMARDECSDRNYKYRIGGLDSRESYILNGIDNTLKINGKENILNNSIVNAYKNCNGNGKWSRTYSRGEQPLIVLMMIRQQFL